MLDLRTLTLRPQSKFSISHSDGKITTASAVEAIRGLPRTARGQSVPWDWPDLGKVVLLTGIYTTLAGATVLLVCLVALSLSFVAAHLAVISSARAAAFGDLVSTYVPPVFWLAIVVGFYGSLLCTTYGYVARRAGGRPASLGIRSLRPIVLARVCGLYVPLALIGMAVTALQKALSGAWAAGTTADLVTPVMLGTTPALVVMGFLYVLVVPCAEELFFRGFLQGLLRNRLPSWAAIGGSGLAYAASHGSLTLLPWLFVMGIGYGVAVSRTGSVFAGIALHIMTNSVGLAGMLVVTRGW